MLKNSKIIYVVVGLVVVAAIAVLSIFSPKEKLSMDVSSFEDCVKAGFPVMESYPRQCRTADGKHFVEVIPEQNNQIKKPDEAKDFTIQGMVICLPHKDTSGPQTMECAYGLRGNDGKNYSLRDTDPEYKNISTIPMNEFVIVVGKFFPKEDERYNSVGRIDITSITVVE